MFQLIYLKIKDKYVQRIPIASVNIFEKKIIIFEEQNG